jgi:hypothetical protein
MKNCSIAGKIALLSGITMILAIFVAMPVFSQETAKKESQKKIVLTIVSDDNGKTTKIDTIIEMPDSAMVDSIKKEIEQVIVLGEGGKHARLKMHNMPQGFDYKFDFPDPPDCPMAFDDLREFDFEGMGPCCEKGDFAKGYWFPGPECREIGSGEGNQSLQDLLGRIPMDRVVSYSIKDRKNGKRIIIDLDNAPVFEKHEKVIVIREPGRDPRAHGQHDRRVKVSVNSKDDQQLDKLPVPATPPTVPPPPPPPDKSDTKKPKI